MAGETIITMIGALTADPEMHFTPNGVGVANFTIASNARKFNKQSGEWEDEPALFMRCTAWRDLGEHSSESLRRGDRVIAVGRLKQRSYEDKEGVKRTVVEMDVDEVGPSLKWATASVNKATRSNGSSSTAEDPWTTGPAVKSGVSAGSGSAGFDDEPPF